MYAYEPGAGGRRVALGAGGEGSGITWVSRPWPISRDGGYGLAAHAHIDELQRGGSVGRGGLRSELVFKPALHSNTGTAI